MSQKAVLYEFCIEILMNAQNAGKSVFQKLRIAVLSALSYILSRYGSGFQEKLDFFMDDVVFIFK